MRSKMMLFTMIASVVYGLVLVFVPGAFQRFVMVPAEEITALSQANLGIGGLALLVVAYWLNVARGLTTPDNIEQMMLGHALGWFAFGAGGIFLIWQYGDRSTANLFLWQYVVFLVIACAFFVMKGRRD